VGEPADAFQRALREERRRSARQINAFAADRVLHPARTHGWPASTDRL